MKVNAITPQVHKIAKKGVAIAAGIALGVAAGTIYGINKVNANNNTKIEYCIKSGNNLTSDTFTSSNSVKGHEFNSKEDLIQQGKTKHFFGAKNGPDKGSKYYRSSEYTIFGYYKGQ